MPRRTDISSILVIGAGPIVIGQECGCDVARVEPIKTLTQPYRSGASPGLQDSAYLFAKFVERLVSP